MTRKSVQGGYCNWPDTKGCALTKLDCDDPANFRSSRQMQNGPSMAHGGSCRWQESVRGTILGRCDDDSSNSGSSDYTTEMCASNLQACPDDTDAKQWTWTGPDPICTVEETKFGRCDYGNCAWSHDQCTEDNTWEAFDPLCTCDKVQVGSCARTVNGEKEVFCAVSELACDDEQSWISPQGTSMASGFDCFLCREDTVTTTTTTTTTTSSSSSSSSSSGSSNVAMATEDADFVSIAKVSSNTTVIVCSVVGTLVGLAIVGMVGYKVFRTRRAVKRAIDGGFGKDQQEQGLPTLAIEVSGNGSEYITDDMDNASVLSAE